MKDEATAPRARKRELRAGMSTVGMRVLGLCRGHTATLLVGFVALALGAGINLLFPYLIRKLLNEELGLELSRDLLSVTLLLVALFGLQALVFYVRHYAFQSVGYRVVSELRTLLYRSIMRQDVEFFDRSRVGDLLSRLSADCQLVQRAVTMNVSVALRYALQVLGGFVLMLVISVRLTLLIMVLLPVITVGAMFWGKRLRVLSRRMQEELSEANVVAEESVGAVRTVRVFAGERYEVGRYDAAVTRSLDAGLERTKVAAMFSSVMVFILHSTIAIVVAYGATLVLRADLSIGDLTSFLFYCVIVAVSFGFLINVWDEFLQAVGAAERIFEIVDSEPKIVAPETPVALPSDGPVSVRFEQVTFAYPTRPELPVLMDLSFEIPAGKTLALVGPSGSGKSTIAALLPRFYDPQLGKIRFSGIDVRSLALDELRSRISFVAQQPQVFSVSIEENIRYGRLDATSAEIEEAARAANIHSFIETLPERYATKVGDRGVQLSGGERQRVAIARALLKDPDVLVLDEATSALDSENEHLVQQALQNLMRGRTTLVIAHRLATVQHADIVLVIRDGKIAQSGTHQSLLNEPGLYQTLVQHQLLA